MPQNWHAVSKMLSFKEKLFVTFLMIALVSSFVVWIGYAYLSFTEAVPKVGGEYIEGVVGQPLYVNPLLSQTSEADSDLTELVYSGLFSYDSKGKLRADLTDSYEISEDQRRYVVHIKKDIQWHDGNSLTANDVLFTISILQDPAYKSPLRQSWQGVDVEKIDDYTVAFNLKNSYFGFLGNLTVGILPKHVWENIAPEKFALADLNLHPVGCGPYMFTDFQKDANGNILTYKLGSFKAFHKGEPHISKITFNFYPDDDTMISAYNKKEIMGINSISPEKIGSLKSMKSTQVHEFVIPRYFAVFFNQSKSVALAEDSVRAALTLSVNRKEIIDGVLRGKGTALYSPIFPQMNGFKQPGEGIEPDLEKAKKILEDDGWKLEGGDPARKKNGNRLAFELVTTDWPELSQNAQLLKEQWAKVGAEVNVKVLTVSDLQQNYIRTREYDSLLFGQAISFDPDLYSFWHSSQKRDPGLNLSLFDNKDADKLLEDIRQESNEQVRAEKYAQLQDVIYNEDPAIFLYSPYYLYPVNKAVQGMNVENINVPSQRFANIGDWYIKTSRVWKK